MFNAIVLWIHILAAVVFVGPQVFLVLAAVPALRTIEDVRQRQAASRVMTRRFGVIGGGALVVLVITGLINYAHVNDLGYINRDEFPRYFFALQIKLALVALVVVLTVLHGAVFGRRLQRLQEEGASEAEIAETRRWSMMLSMATLAASIAILFCAALLGSDWSFG
jgi:copper resistance protein D